MYQMIYLIQATNSSESKCFFSHSIADIPPPPRLYKGQCYVLKFTLRIFALQVPKRTMLPLFVGLWSTSHRVAAI